MEPTTPPTLPPANDGAPPQSRSPLLELVRALRALTIDVEEGAQPNGEAERQMDRLARAIGKEVWSPLLRSGVVASSEVHPLLLEANAAAGSYCEELADLLRALRLAAEAYFGGSFGAPAADLVHSRGFPGWGPRTLCGEPGRVPEVVGEITCPTCVSIHCDPRELPLRLEAIEREYGKPVATGGDHG